MNSAKISNLLEQIKTYCPYTTEWKVFDSNISYKEHGKEIVIPVGADSTPEEELQNLLDRIAPSPDRLIQILSEPIDIRCDAAMALHRKVVRCTLLDSALATGKITKKQYEEIHRTIDNG